MHQKITIFLMSYLIFGEIQLNGANEDFNNDTLEFYTTRDELLKSLGQISNFNSNERSKNNYECTFAVTNPTEECQSIGLLNVINLLPSRYRSDKWFNIPYEVDGDNKKYFFKSAVNNKGNGVGASQTSGKGEKKGSNNTLLIVLTIIILCFVFIGIGFLVARYVKNKRQSDSYRVSSGANGADVELNGQHSSNY